MLDAKFLAYVQTLDKLNHIASGALWRPRSRGGHTHKYLSREPFLRVFDWAQSQLDVRSGVHTWQVWLLRALGGYVSIADILKDLWNRELL